MSKRSFAVSLAATACALALLTACGSTSPNAGSTTPGPAATSATSATSTRPSGACAYNASGAASKSVNAPISTPVTSLTQATLTTNRGAVGMSLDPKDTPCTVNSFVSLVKQGYFNNTPCHRLTTSGIFVLQCGDPTGTGSGGPGYQFDDELVAAVKPKSCDASSGSCIYPAGTVAMANSGANTNGSQFFLVYQDSPLGYNYTIFGQMSAEGLKTVQAIAAKGSNSSNNAGDGAPNESVTITAAATN